MTTEEPIDTATYCSRCGAKEAHYYGILREKVTLGDVTKTITLYQFHCIKCGQITLRRTIMNMTINNFDIRRINNKWTAIRETDHKTIKADTFSELIIKIDQADWRDD